MKRFLFLVLIFQNGFSQEIPLNVQKLIKAYPSQIVGYKDNKVIFSDKLIHTLSRPELYNLRKRMRMLFQNSGDDGKRIKICQEIFSCVRKCEKNS